MADTRKLTGFRLRPELREKLRYLAYLDNMSVNAEVEKILCDYVSRFEANNGVIDVSPLSKVVAPHTHSD